MALLKFLKGNYSSLNTAAIAEGQVLICGDTGEMFVDVAADKRVKIGDFVVVADIASLEALDATAVPTSRLYYVENGNILARSNGTAWIQINKQPTAAELKTLLGLGSAAYTDADAYDVAGAAKAVQDNLDTHIDNAAKTYETKTDAAQKLTDANGYTDTEVAKVQGAIDDLEKYVGTIPTTEAYADIDNVIAYVDKKSAETLAAAQGGSSETAASVKQALETYQAANDTKVNANTEAIEALETSIGTVEEGKTVVGLIETAQSAAQAAQDDVDALERVVGEIPEGETVRTMIDSAEQLAGDAMNAANSKVASVTAGDASVTIAGTATAPTVAAKISADAGNALELAEDGLKVVIPAAAEYTIEKAAESGDYAAVYALKKDGVQVGASINIPKDMVVEAGAVVENPEGQPEGTYIKLILQNVAEPLYINVGSLIEYVTSGSVAGDMVVINVSDDHKVTATITDGSITLAKLSTDIQTAIGKAHSHDNADVLAGITADHVAAWDKAEENASKHADELNTAMNTRVEALEAIDHEHGNKDVIDGITAQNITDWNDAVAKEHEHTNKELLDSYTQTEEDLADAVAKKHAHENAEELAKIASGDVAKWNDAQANAEATAAAALNEYKESNDAAVAKKANSADVYAKTETYTQEEVNDAIAAAVEAQMSWGTFCE